MVAHDTGWRNCNPAAQGNEADKGSPIAKSATSSLPQKVLVALFASLRVHEWQKLAYFYSSHPSWQGQGPDTWAVSTWEFSRHFKSHPE
jgi:hypothetical protein